MSFNYNRTIRNSASYSSSNNAYFTSQSSNAWDDARDVIETYEDQEANFWSNDGEEDDDMECGFFVN